MENPQNLRGLQSATGACKLCHARDKCMSSLFGEHDYKLFDRAIAHRQPTERRELIYMAGDKLSSIFILHSGSVKTYVESVDGDHQITGFHWPGDVLGIHGVQRQIHTDTAEALETSSVCELRFDSFENLLEAFPALQKAICTQVFRELDEEQDMMMMLGKMSAERRVAQFLLKISERMALHGCSAYYLNLTMTRHDIANYLGLAVETVSRLLTRLQNVNIIEVNRRSIFIKDRQQLEHIFDNSDENQDHSRETG